MFCLTPELLVVHEMYPKIFNSFQNILAWSQFPNNFEVLDVDETMLTAKIKTNGQGLAKVNDLSLIISKSVISID